MSMQTTGNNPGLKLFMGKIKGVRPKLLVPHPARARLPNAAQLDESVQTPLGIQKGSSGIHIKPQNRGKFTALQRETGKSTAELKNSPNPLTRKRANFAMMAKRHFKPLGG
jgi:hypothetical protein